VADGSILSAAACAPLLGTDDPAPFTIHHRAGRSAFVLVADHAGQAIPASLGDLGLAAGEIDRHIGWDIGIAGVLRELSPQLDAWAIEQTYSRLVIDCNRPLASPTLMPALSDGTVIAANADLDDDQRQARIDAIHVPYHAAIAAELDRRAACGQPAVPVLLHSFTPVMNGIARPWHCGVLYNRDARLAMRLHAALLAEGDLVVGDNQPYAVSDDSDYGANVHAEGRGLPYVEIEIRQDLIRDAAGQAAWAARLARLLPPLLDGLD
jgi:predicted N-formylglutamate amidohydrolase